VDPPTGAVPARMTLVLGRGPYTLDGELALLRGHGVGLLVTKDSGGPLTVAKLDAARELRVPVVMVDRPPLPLGVRTVTTVEQALAQLELG
jgi:precorrin-6A/cobalt-precorrin-6A reductase